MNKPLSPLRACLAASLFLCWAGNLALGGDWTQWRGPERNGISIGPEWPDKLDGTSLTRLWQVPLGPSYSGPVITGDRVFTTETRGESEEFVFALDRQTGRTLWEASWKGSLSVPFFARENGNWIRSTPATDGRRLFVAGMRDVLVCLDCETGGEIWRIDFVEKYKAKLPTFGFVCSPLIFRDAVIVQAGAAVVSVNAATGSENWRALPDEGGMNGSAFSSPVVVKLAGTDVLLVQTRKELCGLDLATGAVLFRQKIPAFQGMNILTPVVSDDTIFTSAYGGRSFAFRSQIDGSAWSLSKVWETSTQAYMSTPVVIDGFAYLHLRNQRFTCIDLKTGKESWRTTPYGKYWSLVARGKKILALDETGKLYLIRANPEKFELLGSFSISNESAWAHLAVTDDQLFVRSLSSLSAWKWARPSDAVRP